MTTEARLAGQELTRIVYSEEAIARRVQEMGREITETYTEDDHLLVLGLLKGSFIFLADLVRSIDLPLHVDFLVASSYGSDTVSSGNVQLLYDSEATLEDRAVIIVEDIVDSGNTMNRLVPLAKEPRWVGFDAPREFLVGYGLDFSENFRHLPYIASL